MSPVQQIERLLRDTMGLDAGTLGANAIERAVRARLAALAPETNDKTDTQTYWQLLQQSPQELQALIEAVVVPETWFFRHREAFTALAQMATEERAARRGTVREGQALRLLSLPCATGEEPYSMAMALFDAGFQVGDFTIDALDISERALEIARAGVYGRNSFRGPAATLLFRDRYFTPDGDTYRVNGALRPPIRWHAGNLFDATLVDRLGTFDFVFFRNVLIYFDREGQRRAIAALEQLMRMGATLFAGPAEGGALTSNGLASTGHVQAFSFRVAGPVRDVTSTLAGASPLTGTLATFNAQSPAGMFDAVAQRRVHAVQVTATVPGRPLVPANRPAPLMPTPPVPNATTTQGTRAPAPTPRPEPSDITKQLKEARAFADAGDFTRAIALCRTVLATDRANAQAEYLLGLVEDARGDAQQALVHYRRALYLDPGHYEALVHCAAQLEARGDAAGARRLRERAERAERTESTSDDHRHGARHR
ncbi:putative biofilm formation methyltransferase WspC [Pandoraea pneumonica]|uniref:Putative biofilm formation methyltransferase WspC n=1 Tax=Pandoraea pneumonica TaxID=2508299 RepID=A0A5E4UVH2_9BURK|nr:CheR family methyltransferase [Pandoraea pneumonica]VVE02935.1 putative biofilm formation methyltransferase WspC [Pandoraea pneumonica]